ncbi:MAG: metallophosphoesterase [Christensenellaceae bacterium]|jgi:hypothetical protein|nr:metallophosphoesterase [Christensenellaceae bacterium]
MIFIGDVHIAADRIRYSVLKVKSRKESPYSKRFSPRLVHLLETIKWIDDYDLKHPKQKVMQLGDIVSRAVLDAEELSMMEEIVPITQKWEAIRGNHGLSTNGHDSDCAVPFKKMVRTPTWVVHTVSEDLNRKMNIVYLPYVLEKDRKPLAEYLVGMNRSIPTLIVSHNDIKGMDYG